MNTDTWRMWSEPGFWAESISEDDANLWFLRSRDVLDGAKDTEFLGGSLEEGLFRVAVLLTAVNTENKAVKVRNMVVTLARVDKWHVPEQGERNPENYAQEILWRAPVPRETAKETQ